MAAKNTSPLEFSAVSQESCTTPRMKPAATAYTALGVCDGATDKNKNQDRSDGLEGAYENCAEKTDSG